MATTTLTPGETLDRLRNLLSAATERAAGESRMERIRNELREHEDGWTESLERYSSAVHYEIQGALDWDADDRDALQVCQDIQDAIDILLLAIEKSDA
jgi:hypothetical protein